MWVALAACEAAVIRLVNESRIADGAKSFPSAVFSAASGSWYINGLVIHGDIYRAPE